MTKTPVNLLVIAALAILSSIDLARAQDLSPECDRLIKAIETCARRAPDEEARARVLESRKRLLDMAKSRNAFLQALCVNDLQNWTWCSR